MGILENIKSRKENGIEIITEVSKSQVKIQADAISVYFDSVDGGIGRKGMRKGE